MLVINVPTVDAYDERTETFIQSKPITLELEHSLVSLSKWESEFQKPFLGHEEKTQEETLGYLRAMTLTPNVHPDVYALIPSDVIQQVSSYIESKQTATTFVERPQRPGSEIITAEIVYYWMVAQQIDFQCQYWHLNRLLTLIKVVNEKNQPKKKSNLSRREIATQREALNAQRKAKFNTSG